MKKNINVMGSGVDKHELVKIEILDLPKTIRKIFGIALDKRQAKFFEMMGFEKEADIEYGYYAKYTIKKK